MLGLVWTGDVEMQHWTKDVVNESAKKKKNGRMKAMTGAVCNNRGGKNVKMGLMLMI